MSNSLVQDLLNLKNYSTLHLDRGYAIIKTIRCAFSDATASVSIEQFLSAGLQLIIGVEFVKMIAKHTFGSTIEVLVFAIARKLVISHGGTFELLMGVIAIAILFAIRKYLKIHRPEAFNNDSVDSAS